MSVPADRMDHSSAADALFSSANPEVPAPTATPPVESGTPAPAADTQVVDSFTTLDTTDVPEEYRSFVDAKVKSFQADYTRKTQEVADMRKAYEALQSRGVSAQDALQAVEFMRKLDTDPAYTKDIVDHLTGELTRLGMYGKDSVPTPLPATTSPEYQADPNSFEYGTEVPPAMQKELSDLKAQMESLAYDRQVQQHMNELSRQEQAIRQANSDYTDDDFKTIYAIAATTNDLFVANDQYREMQQRIVQGYLNSKEQVPTSIQNLSSTPAIPDAPVNLTFEQAHKAARERVQNVWNAE